MKLENDQKILRLSVNAMVAIMNVKLNQELTHDVRGTIEEITRGKNAGSYRLSCSITLFDAVCYDFSALSLHKVIGTGFNILGQILRDLLDSNIEIEHDFAIKETGSNIVIQLKSQIRKSK